MDRTTPAHLSSLVERDRLCMHKQAAARVEGRGSDSAAAICGGGIVNSKVLSTHVIMYKSNEWLRGCSGAPLPIPTPQHPKLAVYLWQHLALHELAAVRLMVQAQRGQAA